MRRCLVFALLFFACECIAAPFYANADLTAGANDGSSWANAFRGTGCLQTAINAAAAQAHSTTPPQTQEVWAKASTLVYQPIALANNVRVYGGFAGAETLASQSSPWVNVTRIDGGGQERCVLSEYNDNSAVLRGFDLRNGRAPGPYFYDGGGGIELIDSDAMIVNCAIHDCFAPVAAGIAVYWGNPKLVNLKVYNNGRLFAGNPPVEAAVCYGGGGLVIHQTSIDVYQCLFSNNKAIDGGAIVYGDYADGVLHSCTITANTAIHNYGGVLYTAGWHTYLLTVNNTILWGNAAGWNYPDGPAHDPRYTPTEANYSDLLGTFLGGNYFYADPEFGDPREDYYDPSGCSPCHNTGSNALLPPDVADLDWDGNTTEPIPVDIDLTPRKVGGVPAKVDIGAFEGPPQCIE